MNYICTADRVFYILTLLQLFAYAVEWRVGRHYYLIGKEDEFERIKLRVSNCSQLVWMGILIGAVTFNVPGASTFFFANCLAHIAYVIAAAWYDTRKQPDGYEGL